MNEPIIEIVPEVHEANIQQMTEVIERQKENPEMLGLSGVEHVKQSLQTIAAQVAPVVEDKDNPLPKYVQEESAEVRHEVESLLSVVFREGLDHAYKEAHKSTPFIMDAFHDALTGRLYPELQRRGIVE